MIVEGVVTLSTEMLEIGNSMRQKNVQFKIKYNIPFDSFVWASLTIYEIAHIFVF